MPPNPPDSINSCRIILAARGWNLISEQACSGEDQQFFWRLELTKGDGKLTVKTGTPLMVWQEAVELTA